MCESLFLSSSGGIRSTCLFMFEFISRYCTLICPPGREGGRADAGLPTEGASLLGRARGRLGRVVLFLSSHLCAALQGSAYFTRLQTQPLCPQDGAPPGRVWARVSGCKGCVCMYVCVREREKEKTQEIKFCLFALKGQLPKHIKIGFSTQCHLKDPLIHLDTPPVPSHSHSLFTNGHSPR